MKKLFLVALILTCSSGVLFAQMNDANKLNSQSQTPAIITPGVDIAQVLNDIVEGKKPAGLPTFAPIADNNAAKSKKAGRAANSIYQYDTYITDDLVGTAGNGVRDQLMVATPADISYCQRPDAGTPVEDLSEGILFVSSNTFKDTMATKAAPLNKFEFRNVFSQYSNTSIKNTVPYSNNYSYSTPMYLIYYHNYLPLQMATTALETDGNVIVQGNAAQSNIIGCYSLRYDGQDITQPTKYYWLSVHRTRIFKDIFFVLQTLHQRDVTSNQTMNTFLHIVRQGTTTNWQPYIDQLFGK